jgi:hypothetical protein
LNCITQVIPAVGREVQALIEDAPTAFRRTRLLSVQTNGALSIIASGKALFENDAVLPAVAEIICISQ